METQDQKKILAPDNHGVHLCHKCGWPFPNPHPSARHRRAHKRVCGKIDGHKLIDSEASNHSTFSDDEHVSDDDNISPTPKIVETSKTEKGTDKLEEKLKRSEDDVFADAVAEFSESNRSRSFKDCEISDLVQLPSNSIDESLFHHPEMASGTVDRSGAEDASSLQSINIPADIIIDHKKDSMGDLYPIESELDDDTISGRDVISIEENVDSESNVVVETIQPKSKIEETIERASEDSHSNVAIKTFQQEMKIEETMGRALDRSALAQTEILPEVAAKSCSADNFLENKDGGEGHAEENNSNVHVLSVLDDLSISDHPEALPKDFEDNSGLKLEQLASTDSIAGVKFGEDELKARNEGSEEEMPVQGEVNESFVSDSNPKEEQEFKDVPSNVSVVISATEDAPDEGVNRIDKSDTTDSSMEDCKETPQTKLEEIKGLGEEHFPMAAESIDELQAVSARNEGSEEEMPVQGEVNESFVSDSNPKEEQEFKDVPSNVSVVISAIEDAPDEGVNRIDKSHTTDSSIEDCKETPPTKLEEIKGLGEEHFPMAAESIDELQAVSDKDDGSYRELPKTDRKYTDSVSNSSANGINTSTQCGSVEPENLKQNLGLVYNESMEDKILKEGVANSDPLQVEGNDSVIKPHVNASLIDVSADSSSRSDSVEGNWGSVLSVFSVRSDVQAVVENEVVSPTKNQAPAEAEKIGWKIPKASSHNSSRNSDKSDVFEPPSFMTLVEPGRAGGQRLADSEIQNVQNPKPPTTLEAGWFPSLTPVSRDSDGRKKNEEIIAKVTNWSTGKEQHTPLKNLLGKAALEGRPKSPKPENAPPLIRKDEKTANNNGATINSFLARHSPARLQAEIKREKKKVKGRPYWAQFVCCTSANY